MKRIVGLVLVSIAVVTLRAVSPLSLGILTVSPVSCDETQPGSVALIMSGGVPPYIVTKIGDGPNESKEADIFEGVFFNGIETQGIITFSAQDSAGESAILTTVDTTRSVVGVGTLQISPSCNKNTPSGSITGTLVNAREPVTASLTKSGGNPVVMSVVNGFFKFPSLAPGNYTLTVTSSDEPPCNTLTLTFTIVPTDPVAITSIEQFAQDTPVIGGTLIVHATGGSGVSLFAISPEFRFQANNVFAGLTAGTYDILAVDAFGAETGESCFLARTTATVNTFTNAIAQFQLAKHC